MYDAETLCTALPRFYRHASWAAFVRQLDIYGFSRTQDGDDVWVFEHVHFRKNERDLLSLVTRVVPTLNDGDVNGASDRNGDAQDAHAREATALITKLEISMANHERILQYQTRIIELLARNPHFALLDIGGDHFAAHGRDSSTTPPSPLLVGENELHFTLNSDSGLQ